MAQNQDYMELAKRMGEIARAAGDIGLGYFSDGGKTSAGVSYKDGGSPVSEADFAVDTFLHEHLRALVPDAGWLSEESTDDPSRLEKHSVLVVDPIDGTRAFISGDKRWGIAMALVEGGRPVTGVLYMPALNELYSAVAGAGATCNGMAIQTSRRMTLAGATLGGPKKTLDMFEQRGFGTIGEPRIPSLAYRLARVGSGHVDAALASTNAWDWDIAAADLIVRESGGLLTGLDGHAPRYNLPRPRHGILAAAGTGLHQLLVDAVLAIQPA